MSEHNGREGLDPSLFLLGAIFIDYEAQRVIDNQIDLEFRRRIATDPLFAARNMRWRTYDNDFQRRVGERLTSGGSALWALTIAFVVATIAWGILLMVLGADGPHGAVVLGPPSILTGVLAVGMREQHCEALASLPGHERDLVHRHGAHFHAHQGARWRHGHHRLDDPPVPPADPGFLT